MVRRGLENVTVVCTTRTYEVKYLWRILLYCCFERNPGLCAPGWGSAGEVVLCYLSSADVACDVGFARQHIRERHLKC